LRVGEPRETGKIVMLVALAALLVVLSSDSAAVHAQATNVSSQDWSISIAWTYPDQPSGSATTITAVVNVFQTVYNLQITVNGQDLKIGNNLGSGNSYSWNQLNQGDTRQILFVVTTPSQAPVGNKYNVTVKAQSYSTPAGAFGLRSPFDAPNDKASTSFLLQVTPVQALSQTARSSIDWGSISAVAVAAVILVVLLLYVWSRSSW